jgi:hypothetical protein
MILSDFDIGLIQSCGNSTGTGLKRHNRRQVLVIRNEHGLRTDRQYSPYCREPQRRGAVTLLSRRTVAAKYTPRVPQAPGTRDMPSVY